MAAMALKFDKSGPLYFLGRSHGIWNEWLLSCGVMSRHYLEAASSSNFWAVNAMIRVNQLRVVPGKGQLTKLDYILEDQPGFLFRLALRRHTTIFTDRMVDLTPPQFSVVAKLAEIGPTSQNYLGRLISFDQATIKGIVDRLSARGIVELCPDPSDKRRRAVVLTEAGEKLAEKAVKIAKEVTKQTIEPLANAERQTLVRLLKKLI
jgi:DNA-binding MarR family transcriptional regulator